MTRPARALWLTFGLLVVLSAVGAFGAADPDAVGASLSFAARLREGAATFVALAVVLAPVVGAVVVGNVRDELVRSRRSTGFRPGRSR